MKKSIICLLLGLLFAAIVPLSFGQQNQNLQKLDLEIEALKKRISVLEGQLQTVNNVEKMELAAKLADANAKLRNAEVDKYKRELKDANDDWLRTWSTWILGIFLGIVTIVVTILCAIGAGLWSRFTSKTDQLIADSVEKSLNGFKEAIAQVDTLKNELKEAVGQVNILQDQIRILEKEHAASVLEGFVHIPDTEGRLYSETVKALPDGGLLDLIVDKTRGLDFRYKAAEVLAVRKNPKLVSPVLELLNSVVDSRINLDNEYDPELRLRRLVNFLGQIHTQETYEGLTKFINRLLTENSKYKDLFLTWTVFSLAYVSSALNKGDSVSIMRKTISDLDVSSYEEQALRNLVEHFDRFNEPKGIKEILTNGLTDEMPDVETRCLELLQKHDPDFVKEWKAQRITANTEAEETS